MACNAYERAREVYAKLGIDTEKVFKNSTAYIQGWLQKLKSDNRFIVSAAGRAEKAVKYILNIKEE